MHHVVWVDATVEFSARIAGPSRRRVTEGRLLALCNTVRMNACNCQGDGDERRKMHFSGTRAYVLLTGAAGVRGNRIEDEVGYADVLLYIYKVCVRGEGAHTG
jgi:hypothetical protein